MKMLSIVSEVGSQKGAVIPIVKIADKKCWQKKQDAARYELSLDGFEFRRPGRLLPNDDFGVILSPNFGCWAEEEYDFISNSERNILD